MTTSPSTQERLHQSLSIDVTFTADDVALLAHALELAPPTPDDVTVLHRLIARARIETLRAMVRGELDVDECNAQVAALFSLGQKLGSPPDAAWLPERRYSPLPPRRPRRTA